MRVVIQSIGNMDGTCQMTTDKRTDGI